MMQQTKIFSILLFLTLLLGIFEKSSSLKLTKGVSKRQKKYPFDDYAEFLGYPVETHLIQTSDGYVLTFYRLQKKDSSIVEGLPVIYFQHGLLDSSDTSILNDEYRAPGLMMANAGYDVWFGNSRGNFNSRKHIQYTPKQKEFWDFTLQDMSEKDLPAAFEYIHNKTNQKINYIGHSQGTCIMFMALASRNPTILALINKFIALGPVAYVSHMNSAPMNLLAKQKWLFPMFAALRINSFGNPMKIMSFELQYVCQLFPWVCKKYLKYMLDADPKIDNLKRMNYYIWHLPAGTSVQNMKHWMQFVDSGRIQKFDYGKEENLQIYGSEIPPIYDLSKINVPVHLFCGDTDLLADPVDSVRLFNELTGSPNATINMYHLGHATFLIGKNMDYMNDVFKTLRD